jgi:FecR protein
MNCNRRHFLLAASSGFALPAWAQQQPASSIHDLRGEVRVNGQTVRRNSTFKPGDVVMTGSDGFLVFTVANDSFMVRQRTEMRIEPMVGTETLVGTLRLITGAIGAAFQKGRGPRTIITPTATAGIRGTAIYTETRGDGAYFCTCHGAVDLSASANARERVSVEATRHSPYWVGFRPRDGSLLQPATMETHTDEEIDMLEKCVGRRAPWIRT